MPELKIGDRVKVKNQCLTGVIVRWDGADAVVLADVDDDRDEWMEEDDDGTFVCLLSELQKEEEARLEAERILAKQLILVAGYEADDFTIDFVIWASTCSHNTQVLIDELLEKAIEEGNV